MVQTRSKYFLNNLGKTFLGWGWVSWPPLLALLTATQAWGVGESSFLTPGPKAETYLRACEFRIKTLLHWHIYSVSLNMALSLFVFCFPMWKNVLPFLQRVISNASWRWDSSVRHSDTIEMDVIQENKNSHLPELKREGDKGAWVRKADIQFIMRTQKALNMYNGKN